MRIVWIFLAVLAVLFICLVLGTRTNETATVPGSPSGAGKPVEPVAEPLPTSVQQPRQAVIAERHDGVLRVFVKWQPETPRVPLESGLAEIRSEERTYAVRVAAGEMVIPERHDKSGYQIVSIVDSESTELYFHRAEEEGVPVVRCYAYPGIFVRSEGGRFSAERAIAAAEFSGDENLLKNFRVPPSRHHVAPLSGDGVNPTFVTATGPASPFYLLRAEGMAWTRIEAESIKYGAVTTIPALPCGTVVFSAVEASFPRTPRLVVRAKNGPRIMTPRFTPELLEPMDGWPVGDYLAFLTLASNSPRQAVTEIAEFQVYASQATPVPLIVLDNQDVGSGYLRGILQFDAWELVEPWYSRYGFRVEIESLSAPDSVEFKSIRRRNRLISTALMTVIADVETGNPAWSWDAGEYPAGEYRMHVEPLRAWVDFSIRTGKVTLLDQPIPAMAVALLDFSRDVDDIESLSPFLSHPKEWTKKPTMNMSLKLAEHESGSSMMVAPPGDYTFSFVWGLDFHERELNLVEGWNSFSFNLETSSTSVIALVNQDGLPYNLPRSDWDNISVESSSGVALQVKPRHVRKNRIEGWSEAKVDISEGGSVVIKGFSELGLEIAPSALELEEGARHEVVVRSR